MKLKFLSPVQHDADKFAVGDVGDLPKAAAEQLIACGAAEQFDPAAAKAAAKAEAEAKALAEKAEAEAKALAEKAEAEAKALAEKAEAEAAEKSAAEAQAVIDAANKPA